ncbi:MAG: lactonase family protein [Planctomycetaceae bacterium]
MMRLLSLVAFLGLAMNVNAATFVYVSMGPEQKIQIFRQDDTGGLTAIDSVSVAGAPGSLATDPKRRILYASLRTTSQLASFQIDPASGKLTPINTVDLVKGENAAFVGTDRTGRWLLSASYSAGNVVVHRLRDDGSIEAPAVQTVTTAKTAHSVTIDRANKLVLVPHVAPNAIFQFHFDSATGKLTDAGKVAGGTEEAGPRHLALHPKHDFAYSSDEKGSSITCYRLDASRGLTVMQTVSTLPADFKAGNSTAEVKVHPNGKFVWVSNRGHDSLAGFAIDATTGHVSAIDRAPTEKTPRSFEIDPTGRFMFGAGEGSGKLAVFKVDASTGQLERIHTYEVGKSLSWVMALETSP